MRTNVYIDGFNLYYGALRGTAYKWLNPWLMCQALLPQHQIVELKYFTAHLLRDAYSSSADAYVLVTNDSDLAEPIRIVRQELNARVGVLNPHRKPAHKLRKVASFLKPIRKGVLGASQFATTLHDANGTITKPASW